MRLYLYLTLFATILLSHAQTRVSTQEQSLSNKRGQKIVWDQSISSVVVKGEVVDFSVFTIITESDTIVLSNGEMHGKSGLIIFESPITSFFLESEIQADVTLKGFYVPPVKETAQRTLQTTASCEEPSSVSYDVWRQGLPEPTPGRISTPVEHIIIHHSAGSNSATNYQDVVRNIYLYHTEDNGWDDIGYNYLIAQNGQIFKGRDPDGVDSQDNIQGAHYCGKNQYTMGICLLGNYNTTLPPSAMLSSLYDLITWKCLKEGYDDIYRELLHPADGTGFRPKVTPRISTHQYGCSIEGETPYTECPGDFVIERMESIRDSVQHRLSDCDPLKINSKHTSELAVFPNPTNGILNLLKSTDESLAIYTTEGKKIDFDILDENNEQVRLFVKEKGIFVVEVGNSQRIKRTLVMIY